MPDRRDERIDATLAVVLEQGLGVTRNVSASGVYFETDAPLAQGAALSFSLSFDDALGGPLLLKCEAKIVRIEDRGGMLGVGASITNFKFERVHAGAKAPV